MTDHSAHNDQRRQQEPVQASRFWRSRVGVSLIVAFVIGGLLLSYEHRAHILDSEWLLWLPLLICVGMHFFMHGGHGGHGSGGDKS